MVAQREFTKALPKAKMNFSRKTGTPREASGAKKVFLNSVSRRLSLKGFFLDVIFARAIMVKAKWAAIEAIGRK